MLRKFTFKNLFLLLVSVIIWGGAIAPTFAGSPAADTTVTIPSLDLSASIVEIPLTANGWDVSRIGYKVAHLGATSWVGEGGNIVIGGHVDRIFGSLNDIAIGDTIIITQDGVEYQYQVREKFVVPETDVSVTYATPHEQLTIITCNTYNARTRSYTHRLVVVADRIR